MFEGLRGLCRATPAAMLVFAIGFADARAIAQPPPPPPPAVAGYGGRYTIFDVSTPAGNTNCLAVAGLGGDYYVSGTRLTGGKHRIYVFDGRQSLLFAFNQPSAQQRDSQTGITGMTTDGANLIGCSEAGISVFDARGGQVNKLIAANGPQTISQPIRGPVLRALGMYSGVAWNPAGAQGNGSFYVTNGVTIQEMDLAGSPLGRHWNPGGPEMTGLLMDVCVVNSFWVAAGDSIQQFDTVTGKYTDQSFPSLVTGLSGGLGPLVGSSTTAWRSPSVFASLDQGPTRDTVSVFRIHLDDGPDFPWCLEGYNEGFLQLRQNSLPFSRGPIIVQGGDTVEWLLKTPGVTQTAPAMHIFNFGSDTEMVGTSVLPGDNKIFRELISLSSFSNPASSTAVLFSWVTGVGLAVPIPTSIPPTRVRVQTVFLSFPCPPNSLGLPLWSSNEVYCDIR